MKEKVSSTQMADGTAEDHPWQSLEFFAPMVRRILPEDHRTPHECHAALIHRGEGLFRGGILCG